MLAYFKHLWVNYAVGCSETFLSPFMNMCCLLHLLLCGQPWRAKPTLGDRPPWLELPCTALFWHRFFLYSLVLSISLWLPWEIDKTLRVGWWPHPACNNRQLLLSCLCPMPPFKCYNVLAICETDIAISLREQEGPGELSAHDYQVREPTGLLVSQRCLHL